MRHARPLSTLILAALFTAISSAAAQTPGPSATLAAAAQAIEEGELNRAELLLLELLDRSPPASEEAAAHLGLSRVYELRGALPTALEQARRAEEVVPDSPATVLAVGRTLARLGAAREAVVVLERARALAPADPAPAILEALVLRDAGQVEQAAAVLESVWAAGLLAPEIAEQLGALHLTLDNPSRTLEVVDAALEISPDHATLVLLKGLALGKNVDARRDAITLLRRALELGPPNPGRVWLELGIMLLDEGDHQAALPALDEAKKLRPDDPEFYYPLSSSYPIALYRY